MSNPTGFKVRQRPAVSARARSTQLPPGLQKYVETAEAALAEPFKGITADGTSCASTTPGSPTRGRERRGRPRGRRYNAGGDTAPRLRAERIGKHEIVDPLHAIHQVLEPRADVRLAYVFGSAARGQVRPASDVDIAVLFDPVPTSRDLDALTSVLQSAAGRAVDLVVLNTAPPLLTHEILKSGRRLVTRAEDERVRFETRATARYLDTAYLRRVQHRYLRERADAFRARQS